MVSGVATRSARGNYQLCIPKGHKKRLEEQEGLTISVFGPKNHLNEPQGQLKVLQQSPKVT